MNTYVKLSFFVLLTAAFIAWYRPNLFFNPVAFHNAVVKIPFLAQMFKYFHGTKSPVISSETQPKDISGAVKDSEIQPERVFTKDELSAFKGENGGDIYLALLGQVFDVTTGRDYYGPGGGYAFFSGIDGSRAFVSGDFTPAGLIEDISGLKNEDYLGLKDWVEFYAKDYKYLGKLQGMYYDSNGKPTKYYYQVQQWINNALKGKEEEDQFKEKYPMCNIDYKPEEGTRIWCSTASGGVKRDWVGVPRSLHSADSKSVRCACVQESDLDDPMLKEYPNCPKDAVSCKLSN
nr:EOG090X0A5G [Ilyocryptus agilis]